MNLKVNYKELENIGTYVESKTVELRNELNDIKNVLSTVETTWQGTDSEVFVANVTAFIEEQKKDSEKLTKLSEMIKVSSKVYHRKDTEWEQEIKEGEYYEA